MCLTFLLTTNYKITPYKAPSEIVLRHGSMAWKIFSVVSIVLEPLILYANSLALLLPIKAVQYCSCHI